MEMKGEENMECPPRAKEYQNMISFETCNFYLCSVINIKLSVALSLSVECKRG